MWRGLQTGDVLAHRYRIVKCIGQGGMGRVFAAEDLKLSGKRWAVKEWIAGESSTDVSDREAEILLKLDHPNLPDIVDYYHFPELSRSYLVMELVKGQTITEWTRERGKASESFVVQIGMQLCNILMYLHGQKPHPLIHRDLKPDNVMLDGHEHVHLIDFGIARQYKENQQNDTIELGTPASLAPEQRSGRQTDERTDLYQLGGVLYYMLSGGKYYESAQDVWTGLPDISPALRELLLKLLSELPEDRPSSAAEVKAELAFQSVYAKLQSDPKRSGGQRVEGQAGSHKVGFIVVASLYPGAGATRTACGLAAALEQLDLACSVVEYAKHPEYVYMLGGEDKAPNDYTYLIERRESKHKDETHAEWKSRSIVWYPMPPQTEGCSIGLDRWYSSLLFIRTPVTIIDVGHRLDDEFVKDMMNRADHLVIALDARTYKWYRKDIEQRLEKLVSRADSQGSLHIAAHMQSSTDARIWRELPLPIRVKIPQDSGRLTSLDLYAPLLKACGLNLHKKLKRSSRRRLFART